MSHWHNLLSVSAEYVCISDSIFLSIHVLCHHIFHPCCERMIYNPLSLSLSVLFSSFSQGFFHRGLRFRFRISNLVHIESQRGIGYIYLSRKNFSPPRRRVLVSLRSFLSLSAIGEQLYLYVTDRREWMWGTGGGKQEGVRNEESGSMLGQHIKIMASIGADAPYIPIRGKGLRLISIASRYPSPGWKARARARARSPIHAHARLTHA